MGSFSEIWVLAGGADTLVGTSDDTVDNRDLGLPEDISIVGTYQNPNILNDFVNLFLHVSAVSFVSFFVASDICANFQHIQIIFKMGHAEVRGGNPRFTERVF